MESMRASESASASESMGRAGSARAHLAASLPARSRRREVWTGVFVIIGVLALLTALFTLTDAATFRGRYIVTTEVPDAGGIRRGDPVQMRGVNIGRVQRFEMVPDGVAIRLELEGEYRVPRDSRVILRSAGVLGGVVAEIQPGRSSERLRGNDLIPGTRGDGVLDMMGDVGTRANEVLDQLRTALSDQMVSSLGAGTEEIRGLVAELNRLVVEQRRGLNELASSLNRSATNVEQLVSAPELGRIVARVEALATETEAASAALSRASTALEVVLARIERGEGTLGRLSTDDRLYDDISRAAVSLDSLLTDVRTHPERYFRVRIF